jgi:glutathione S-transferase
MVWLEFSRSLTNSAPLRCFAADNPAHSRIVAQALGVVHILVSGQATKYRLPEQPGQCVPTILATACVGQNITRHLGGAAAALTERYLSAIAASERFLVDNEFIGGASFSIADIAAFTIISAVNRHLAWDQLPRLAAWHDRIGRRPAVQTGMAAFDDKRDTVN